MSIKPIDMQVNVGQMPHVARGEQDRIEGLIQQQHGLEKESDEKSRLTRSRLEENKKGEQTSIKHEEGSGRGKNFFRKKKEKDRDPNEGPPAPSDRNLGQFIDIKK